MFSSCRKMSCSGKEWEGEGDAFCHNRNSLRVGTSEDLTRRGQGQGCSRKPLCPQTEGEYRTEDPDTQSQSNCVLLASRLSGTGSRPNSRGPFSALLASAQGARAWAVTHPGLGSLIYRRGTIILSMVWVVWGGGFQELIYLSA